MYNKQELARDPHTIVIGVDSTGVENVEGISAFQALQAGEVVYETLHSAGAYRLMMIACSNLMQTHPAMASVCLGIVDKDEKATLPRGLERRLRTSSKRRYYQDWHCAQFKK